jgi:hypothetical protein
LLFACGKSDDKKAAGKAGGKAAAAKKAKAAPAAYKDIKWMGLKAKVAGDAEISDTSADAPAAMIYSGECTIMLSTVTAAYPSFESAVSSAEKGVGNKVKTWIKKEKTADGFHIEYEGTSLMDEPVWDVTVRRKIGDKEYECTRAGDKAAVACIAEVCASLQAI